MARPKEAPLKLDAAPLPDIVGHRRLLERLSSYHAQRWRGGTFLFTGMPGLGKRLIALRFAMGLICENRTFLGCQNCAACRKVLTGQHPDVRLAEPPSGRQHAIDTIREFQTWLAYQPWHGDLKVFIWDDAEHMRTDAANAMLKSLEEPPADTLIILVSGQPYRVLPTIRSRSQIFRFGVIAESELTETLITRFRRPQNEARWIARMSRGCPGIAFRPDPYWPFHRQLRERVFRWFMDALSSPDRGWMGLMDIDVRDLVPMAVELTSERVQVFSADGWMWSRWWAEQILRHMVTFAVDMLYLAYGLTDRMISIDLRQRLEPLVNVVDVPALERQVERWLTFIGSMRTYHFSGIWHIPALMEVVVGRDGFTF